MIIVATTSLPAFDRPNADRWNAARSCQFLLQKLFEMEIWNAYTLCNKDLKRYLFLCLKLPSNKVSPLRDT